MSNKKKKQGDKDILVVLFIIAVIVFSGFAMTLCGSESPEPDKISGNGSAKQKDDDKTGEIVMVTSAAVAVCVIICFAVKKSRDIKRRNEAIRAHNKRIAEQQRLEEAKERVRQARLQEMIDAGIEQLTNKNSRNNTSRRNWQDEYVDNRFDNYDRYELFDDELDDEEVEEDLTFVEKVKERISDISVNKLVIAGVIALAVVAGVVIVLLVL